MSFVWRLYKCLSREVADKSWNVSSNLRKGAWRMFTKLVLGSLQSNWVVHLQYSHWFVQRMCLVMFVVTFHCPFCVFVYNFGITLRFLQEFKSVCSTDKIFGVKVLFINLWQPFGKRKWIQQTCKIWNKYLDYGFLQTCSRKSYNDFIIFFRAVSRFLLWYIFIFLK